METSSDHGPSFRQAGPLTENLGQREAACPSHGVYLSTGVRFTTGKGREVWQPCPGCAAERQAAEDEDARRVEMERKRAKFDAALGRAAIPARFLERTFASYRMVDGADKQAAALAACRDYAENFDAHRVSGESLVLVGKRGTGKTHLAAAILQHILPEHIGLYTTAQDMIGMIRATWGKDAERSTESVMRLLYGVPLLVVDEVGVQSGTENEQNLLFQVLDHRYRERKAVVLMGNMKLGEMRQFLGDRVYDRVKEIAKVIPFEWDSYRTQARKDEQA